MRISNTEAKARAIRLAENLLAAQPEKPGWSYRCIDAVPDEMATDPRNGKTWVNWSVVVDWSLNNSVVDGPAIVRVNVLTESAHFEPSP